ncbi:hypothetical protein BB561_001188 [Smittium simulii]|uniref:Transcriptional adapter 2 n=1 Tax=Smittium simulii TaxID=133385 RepID=A0A2T9YVQ0_9FUNG|nr:hypothetical protein BB561_001188 [Smittium simulii]
MSIVSKSSTTNSKPNEEIFSTGQRYHCDECQANLTEIVKISCAECPEFDLCVSCFAKGVELGSHKREHAYSVVSKHTFPIFSIDWTADEELLLIDGLIQFGMGNWEEVATYVTSKTKEECEQHYYDTYVESKDWPLPVRGPEAKRGAKSYPIIKSENKQTKVYSSQPSNHEIAGYMPGRNEFEVEHENEAEQIIKDLTFLDEDTSEDHKLKLSVLEIYNNKLNQRIDRKNFMIDRGLFDYSKIVNYEKKKTAAERDLLVRLKTFAKIQSSSDYKLFVDGMLTESTIKNRILQLKEWRSNGITTLSDGAIFESERSSLQSKSHAISSKDCIQNLEKIQKLAVNYSQRHAGSDISNYHKTPTKKFKPNGLKQLDGAQLLSLKEMDLCEKLSILPTSYILVKDVLLTEYVKSGKIDRERSYELLEKVDPSKVDSIYDFYLNAGWIS